MLKIREYLIEFKKVSYIQDSRVDSQLTYVDCSLGINPFGYSPCITDIFPDAQKIDIGSYPDADYTTLKEQLAKYWVKAGISEKNFMIGAGSISFLERINNLFIDIGSKVLGYCPQFPDYAIDVSRCGGIYEYVSLKPETGYRFCSKDIIDKLKNDAYRVLYIDNPNNPTGQVIPLKEINCIAKTAKELNVCVLVDEAYGDFMKKDDSAINLINKYDNLFITRTFSKGFGLGGLRVGYAVAGEMLSKLFKKVEMPLSVSKVSEILAVAALSDNIFLRDSIKQTKKIKQKIISACKKITVFNTAAEIPIMVLAHPNKEIDFYNLLRIKGVITEPGCEFTNLGRNCIRLRIPSRGVDKLISIIKEIEEVL